MQYHIGSFHSAFLTLIMVKSVHIVIAQNSGEDGHHLKVGPPASLMRDRAHIQDKDHIKSHLQDTVDPDALDNMSPHGMQFHYFHSHDTDHNKKLDGLELMQSILHVDEGWSGKEGEQGVGVMSEEKIIKIVDVILEDDDINQDGYVDYVEFSRGLDDGHIREHLDGIIDLEGIPESEMTEKQLQLHYFKIHDYDHNNKLDGLELLNAMTHYHHDGSPNAEPLKEDDLMNLIDPIFRDDDKNNDGYIDYPEYALTQG